MASIFVLLSEKPNPQLGLQVLSVFTGDHYPINDTQWLISGNMLSKDVLEKLGASKGEYGLVAVFKVENYFGWHNKNMWEWLALKDKA